METIIDTAFIEGKVKEIKNYLDYYFCEVRFADNSANRRRRLLEDYLIDFSVKQVNVTRQVQEKFNEVSRVTGAKPTVFKLEMSISSFLEYLQIELNLISKEISDAEARVANDGRRNGFLRHEADDDMVYLKNKEYMLQGFISFANEQNKENKDETRSR